MGYLLLYFTSKQSLMMIVKKNIRIIYIKGK